MNPDVAARAQGADGPVAPNLVVTRDADARTLQRLRADIIGHHTVPSAPAILFEILRLLSGDDGDLRKLFGAIERDPGLTAKVLRMANGTFFGQSRTVASVDRAVTVLGVAMVRSLAVSVAVFDSVGSHMSAAEADLIWRHSLATGVVARTLAARAGLGHQDDAFTAGLLHDAGRMLLGRRFPELYHALPPGGPVELAERAAIGVDHAVVAGWLFEAWQLPAPVVAAVAQHHASPLAPGLPAVVAAANLMTRHPDGQVLLAEASDPQGALARAAAAACGLTLESWAEVARGLHGEAGS